MRPSHIFLLKLAVFKSVHQLDVPDVPEVTVVDGQEQVIADDSASFYVVDERSPNLAFPVVGRCVGPSAAPPSRLLPLGSDWLYAAYFDDRLTYRSNSSIYGVIYIRALALLRRRSDRDRNPPKFRFRWPQSGGNAMTTTTSGPAELYEMCENHGRRYGGWILSAKFTGRRPPCSVLVTHDQLGAADQVRLPVFRMSAADRLSRFEEDGNFRLAGNGGKVNDEVEARKKPRGSDFAVCVPPLYGTITPATLVQFVELTGMLGAQHFVFYVGDVSDCLRRVLGAYEAEAVATTIPWAIPPAVAQSTIGDILLIDAYLCLAMLHAWTLEYQHMMLCV